MPGVGHHLGLAEFLAGDAPGAGLDLHGGDHRALVGLDMRPVGDACGIAGRLDAGDVALDPVHVDDGGGRAVFTGDSGGEGCGHDFTPVQYARHCERSEAIHLSELKNGLLRRFAPRNDGRWS